MIYHEIYSPVVGAVAFFVVEDGAIVEDHQMIGAVESMKTMFDIRAPAAGIVRLKVKLGETIGQNDVIAIVESEG